MKGLTVRNLTARDLVDADRINRIAFGTFFGLEDPATFRGDGDVVTLDGLSAGLVLTPMVLEGFFEHCRRHRIVVGEGGVEADLCYSAGVGGVGTEALVILFALFLGCVKLSARADEVLDMVAF